jgi:hypothetical protein
LGNEIKTDDEFKYFTLLESSVSKLHFCLSEMLSCLQLQYGDVDGKKDEICSTKMAGVYKSFAK